MAMSQKELAATRQDASRDATSEATLRLVRMVGQDRGLRDELLRDRQMVRLDALKILIGCLVDQLEELTNATAPDDEMDSILQSSVRRFETELIRQALIRTGGKQRSAARLLGEKKTTLNAKIIRYGIKVEAEAAQSQHLPAPHLGLPR